MLEGAWLSMTQQGEAETMRHDSRRRQEPGRLLTQRTHFAGPTPHAPDDLYCLVEGGVATRDRGRLSLHGYARVSTNTYFGRFPASYWQRWTPVREVGVEAVVTGSGLVRVMASDARGEPRTVGHREVVDAAEKQLHIPAKIDRFVDGGALWLEISTADGGIVLDDVRWTVHTARPRRRTAIVICTYNRADDCLATLETLAGDAEALACVDQVYVIDQGSDPVESRTSFRSVQDALAPRLTYIRQPNLGGSGGFTRGMYEMAGAATDDGFDVLLMDDDIMLEPDAVVRMTAFASRTTEPTIVGAQMLNLLHPRRLHVSAERADLGILRAGLPVEEALSTADVTEEQQDLRVDAQYNAWWSCLLPSEVLAAVGYPLPLFFQWDDIEYGIRAGAAGFATVTLPGAGVWHADFEWKNWDDWSRYFSYRNSLITSALHSDFDRQRIVGHLSRQLAHCLVTMRYGLAATLIRAVEDFLRGPDVLEDGGNQVAAEIRKMRAEYPETSNHPASAVPGLSATRMPLAARPGFPSMPKSVLAKRLTMHLLRKSHGTASISAHDAKWWHVSLFDTAIVTDPSQEGVRIHRRDRALMIELGRRGARVLLRLMREGERAQAEYRDRLPELTSRENWTRLYECR